jgi:hypothetical protein
MGFGWTETKRASIAAGSGIALVPGELIVNALFLS